MPLRPFCAAAFVSLALGGIISAAALRAGAGGGGRFAPGENWAVLEVPDTVPVRELAEKLEAEGVRLIAESSMKVLLSDFDALKELELDRYEDHVESFDPRNDGYARALRAFFTAEGKRRFFLGKSGRLLRAAGAALEGLPAWSLDTGGALPAASLVSFAVAAAVFALSQLRPGGFVSGALCVIPALFPLAFAGAAGLAACGLLAALFSLSRPVLEEYFRHFRRGFRRLVKAERRELAALFPEHLAASGCCFLLYAACCVAGGIHPVISVSVPVCFCLVLVLSHKAGALVVRNLFFPLPIRKKPPLRSLVPPLMFVFFAAAVPAALFRPLPPPASGYGPLPTAEDYAAHAAFQASFSFRSLNGEGEYGSYELGGGLITGFTPSRQAFELPPPPEALEELWVWQKRRNRDKLYQAE